MIWAACIVMALVIWACVAALVAIMVGRAVRIADERRPRYQRTM
jgi:hypothetical protein